MTTTVQKNIHTKYVLKATLFCIVFTGLLAVFSFAKGFVSTKFERLLYGLIGTFAGLLTTLLFLKFDRKRFSDIELVFQRTTLLKFFTGIVAGAILMGLMAMGVLYFSNANIRFNSQSNPWHFLLMTSPLIPLAFMEELGFRAYPLEILKDKTGIRLAVIITAILFALYHIANGWTIASSFYGTGVWGLLFGLAAVYSRC